ncbi:glycosyltransferase family 8 protein [Paenibacillus sp. FSL R10-2199]|uniref:glycosyltransferase family 8 protein n=1 Tax=Paenibacillus sp. FSL R10-2199 TaxID=2975348 RepID=UPI0030FB3549
MRLNVAYACGEEYVRHAGVSMISLLANNKSFDDIFIYLIENNITEESKFELQNIVKKYNRNIVFVSCTELCDSLKADDQNGRYSIATYSKLFYGKFEEIDKIIYLDCDTSVSASLEELWKIDLNSYSVAGVWDDAAPRLKSSVNIHGNEKYINTGFLLMNLNNWRKNNYQEKCISFINTYNGNVPFLDQGVINSICKGDILILSPKFNLMSYLVMHKAEEIEALCEVDAMYTQKEIDEAIKQPVIIHWVTGFYNRPWCINCTHPLKEKYLMYLEISPWAGQLVNSDLSIKTKMIHCLYKRVPFFLYRLVRKASDKRKGKILYGK